MTRPTQVPSGRRFNCRVRDCHPLWSVFPNRSASRLLVTPIWKALQPRRGKPPRFGLFPVRSPLLRKSIFLSFPPVTEMFQFTGLAATCLWIQHVLIRESRDQHSFVNSPRLFADFHALHRLLTPRHPPCALCSLTTRIQPSRALTQKLDHKPLRAHGA